MTHDGQDPSSSKPGMHDEIDFDAIDSRLGWAEPTKTNAADNELMWQLASRSLAELLQCVVFGCNGLKPHTIGYRVLAILHEIDPALVGGRSLWQIADEVGVERATLSLWAIRVRESVGMAGTRGQSLTVRQRARIRAKLVHLGKWKTSDKRERRNIKEAKARK